MKYKKLLCFIFVLCLLALFSKFGNIHEQLEDAPLKSYLAAIDSNKNKPFPSFKNYIKGYKLGPGCEVTSLDSDSTPQFGTSWQATYNNDNNDIIYDVCVPDLYESSNSYIPCSSQNIGPPDLKGCNLPDSDCQAAIDAIKNGSDFPAYHKYRKVETKDDIQQYLFQCEKNDSETSICPCMYKWGQNHNPYNCNAPLKSYNCDQKNKKCIEVEGNSGQYETLGACQDACNPLYTNGWSCESTINGPICVKKEGPYSSEDSCNLNCGPPYKKGFNCESVFDKKMCVPVSEKADYPDYKSCNLKCSKEPLPQPLDRDSGNNPITPCFKFLGKNVNTKENNRFYDRKCKKHVLPTSQFLGTTSIDCPQPGYARAICSWTSPAKLKKIP